MPHRISIALLALLCLFASSSRPASAASGDEDWQTWANVTAIGGLGGADSPWRGWFEGQARFADDSSQFQQGIGRAGVGYDLGERTTLWTGYAYIPTEPLGGPEDTFEHRLWQQLTWQAPPTPESFSWNMRTRLEQRFLEGADDTGWRLRHMVRMTHPLGSSQRYDLTLWDEVFVNVNDTDWGARDGFDQNRLFAGIGVALAPRVRTEIGYLHQYVERSSRADAVGHTLSLNLFLRF